MAEYPHFQVEIDLQMVDFPLSAHILEAPLPPAPPPQPKAPKAPEFPRRWSWKFGWPREIWSKKKDVNISEVIQSSNVLGWSRKYFIDTTTQPQKCMDRMQAYGTHTEWLVTRLHAMNQARKHWGGRASAKKSHETYNITILAQGIPKPTCINLTCMILNAFLAL